jgi:hypothetical protein
MGWHTFILVGDIDTIKQGVCDTYLFKAVIITAVW